MSNIKAMCVAIDQAAGGYAERITREAGRFDRFQGPAIDYGVRTFAVDLVKAGLVDADKLFEFLDNRKYRENTPTLWWIYD